MTDATNTLIKFTADEVDYTLEKIETTDESMISAGQIVTGDLTLITFPPNPDEVMVAVTRSFSDYLRTSPVKEITDIKENSLEFKTMSGGKYRLSK